jgi:hypothetical protein
LVRTGQEHRPGARDEGSSNAYIQAAKAKARGYRTTRNLITIAYLIAGKLDLTPARA